VAKLGTTRSWIHVLRKTCRAQKKRNGGRVGASTTGGNSNVLGEREAAPKKIQLREYESVPGRTEKRWKRREGTKKEVENS